MKVYIYSFINKLNGHRYIGKTNNVERRRREHKSMAFNPKVIETHDCLWYKKIRQYGWDGFDFEILDVANEDNWKEKEKYWISYYNTFNGVGYNTTPGGDGEGYGGILSDEEVDYRSRILDEAFSDDAKHYSNFNEISDMIFNEIKSLDDAINEATLEMMTKKQNLK